MDTEILKRLYMACSDDGPHYKAGLNLCELYENIPETGNAEDHFLHEVDAAGLPFDTLDKIMAASTEENIAYEMQGFVNGFRLGLRLAVSKGHTREAVA